jgi:hypothetical protein
LKRTFISLIALGGIVLLPACKNPLGNQGPCPHRTKTFQGKAFTGLFRPFFGNLHAHTGYSDGVLDPSAALAYARDRGGLDFMATTDHHEYLAQFAFEDTIRMARAETIPGRFVGLAGFEWSHGLDLNQGKLINHINVFGTPRVFPKVETSTLEGFWCELLGLPEGAFGQFNHPDYRKRPLETNHWNDFKYDAFVDARICLSRAEKGSNAAEKGYIRALEKGWHVSPTSNQDNHGPDWGTKNSNRTGVWAASLGEKDLLDAIREMRTFSTTDADATIRLMADSRFWMGSVLKRRGAVTLTLEATDAGPAERFTKLELFATGGKPVEVRTIQSASPLTIDFRVDPPGSSYYFVRLTQADGDELLSAPIWIER